MSLRDAQNYVRAFHQKFGVDHPSEPVEPSQINWGRHKCRIDWIDSEGIEVRDGCMNKDRAELADGYIDIIVFALGGLVELGVDGSPLFDAVMKANMTKIKVPGVSKIQKPEGFVHPDIGALIEEQRRK